MALAITDTLKFRESVNDDWQRLLIQANINFNLIYPVGSIYMSTVNVDPGTIFGGTWEQLKDTFLLGAGDTYTAGDTGGEAEHTLTMAEMPSHRHTLHDVGQAGTGTSTYGGVRLNQVFASNYTNYAGNDQPHNNMPPYIVVYMWKRLTLSPALTPLPMNVLGDVASEDIVPVSKGGTGADNAADARTNLGVEWGDVTITQSASMAVIAKSDGRIIMFSIGGYQSSAASGSVIATVAADYRPSVAQWMSCTAILGSSGYAVRLLFDTDGTISVYDLPSVGTWSFGGSAIAFL